MIDTADKLASLLPRLRAAEWLGLDTEADSLHSYPEKLCLLQLGLPGETLLLDPLAGLDLAGFWQIIGSKELILHGSDYDLRLLHRTAGFVPAKVFDTMLAARLLGIREFGLNSLLRSFLGVNLEKGSQKANWSIRPLTDRMVAYALADAHYLKPLADELRTRLLAAGRVAWHEELCQQQVREATHVNAESPDDVWRIKAADKLSRRSLAVLRELWLWREAEAVGANRPPFFVLSHETLFAMAERAGAGQSLEPLVPRRYSPRRRSGLLEAAGRAMGLPESRLPHPRRHRGQRMTGAQRERAEALRRRRDAAAHHLAIEPSLIASKATLNDLARDWDAYAPRLLHWQRELLDPDRRG